MIAMNYGVTLPADYDTAIIDRRIAEKGSFTDGWPGLVFKAYLSARKTDPSGPGENRYAPFYLWESTAAMNTFLCGPGFAALADSFGRPAVHTWSVWWAQVSERAHEARYASIDVLPIGRHANLRELQQAECQLAAASMETGDVLAAVAGFDPGRWKLVRFGLWPQTPPVTAGADVYALGHLSRG